MKKEVSILRPIWYDSVKAVFDLDLVIRSVYPTGTYKNSSMELYGVSSKRYYALVTLPSVQSPYKKILSKAKVNRRRW